MADEVVFKEGAVIYFEKDHPDNIYIIRQGILEQLMEVQGAAPKQLGAGEIVGLSDLFGGQSRISTVRAVTNVTATRIDADEFKGMLTNNTAVALKVITSLCAELREIDELIVRRLRGGSADFIGKSIGLRIIADFFRRKGMNRAARYAYGRYLETDPAGEERLESAMHLAGLCEKDGDIEIALQIYGRLVKEFPDDARALSAFNRLKGVMNVFGDKL